MASTKDYCRKRVYGGKKGTRKIGKIAYAVLHPSKPRVVGFMVKRPDLLLMFKREDCFVALDCLEPAQNGGYAVLPGAKDAWGSSACKRLGIDLDECIIWENMNLITRDGDELGRVGRISFSSKTGKVSSITASDGALARKILGSHDIPVSLVVGYSEGHIVLEPQANEVDESGGWAAKAGAASAKAMHKVGQVGNKATEKTGQAIDSSSRKAGQALGRARKAMNDKVDGFNEKPPENTAAYKVGEALGGFRDKMKTWAESDED